MLQDYYEYKTLNKCNPALETSFSPKRIVLNPLKSPFRPEFFVFFFENLFSSVLGALGKIVWYREKIINAMKSKNYENS